MAKAGNPDRQLTAKQEEFLHLIMEGETRRDAYYKAHGCKETMKPNVASVKAWELMQLPHVKRRFEELRNMAAGDPVKTLRKHIRDLEVLRNRAVQDGQIGAAITAEIAIGRAAGVAAPDKVEVTQKNGTLPASVDDFV